MDEWAREEGGGGGRRVLDKRQMLQADAVGLGIVGAAEMAAPLAENAINI